MSGSWRSLAAALVAVGCTTGGGGGFTAAPQQSAPPARRRQPPRPRAVGSRIGRAVGIDGVGSPPRRRLPGVVAPSAIGRAVDLALGRSAVDRSVRIRRGDASPTR